MTIKSELDTKSVLACVVVSAILLVNVVLICVSIYVFRYAIYCGIGIGSHALLFYVPSLVLLMATFLYKGSKIAKIRNVVLLLNGCFIALLFLEGTCFSCVDACVENLRQ